MAKKRSKKSLPAAAQQLRELVGQPALLPDESPAAYEQEFMALVQELRTDSPLAIVLTEQLLEAIRWARRHTADKANFLVNAMAWVLQGYLGDEKKVRECLLALRSNPDDADANAYIQERCSETGHTLETARATAIADNIDTFSKLDDLIARQLRNAQQLQKAIAAIEVQPHLLRRLELQVADLERDIQALPHGDQ